MYVHIPITPEQLRKRPWIGIAIGLVGVGLMLWLANAFWGQYQYFRRVTKPQDITVEGAYLSQDQPRKWVTLHNAQWQCAWTVERENDIPERWVFGRVDTTQIPLTDEDGVIRVVLNFDGGVDCAEDSRKPVTGILTRQGDSLGGTRIEDLLKNAPGGKDSLIISVDASPAKTRNYLLISLGFLIGFTIFAGYYFRLWITKRFRRRDDLEQVLL